MLVLKLRDVVPLHGGALVLFDQAHPFFFVGCAQRQRQARFAGAAGAPDSVDVDFGVLRDVDVDHRAKAGDIEAARGDVCCDQHRAAAVREKNQDFVALALFEFAVQRKGRKALGPQFVGQFAAVHLGVAERQGRHRLEMLEQLADCLVALIEADFKEALLDLAGVVLGLDLHFDRIAQEQFGGAADVVRVGGRKQQGLAPLRTGADDAGDFVVKTHVGHPVGLIEYQRLHVGQVQGAAPEVVADTSRRADDDVGAVFERGNLRAHRRAAGQGQYLDVAFAAGEPAQFVRHLVGQFARRAQHQSLDREPGRIEPVQDADAKGRRFAAAGLRLRDQVAPVQYRRQAFGLDRRHLVVAEGVEIGQQGGR